MKINMTLENAHLQYRKYIFKRWMFHCRVSFREGGKFANIDSEQIDQGFKIKKITAVETNFVFLNFSRHVQNNMDVTQN